MSNKFVVHCKKDKYDVYIGRPSKWGNPYRLGSEEDREIVLKLYKEWLEERPELLLAIKKELKGKILGCWCAPRICHGDVLSEIANVQES